MSTKHTQGKLTVVSERGSAFLKNDNEEFVAGCYDPIKSILWANGCEANAQRLAICWNSHDHLVDALQELVNYYDHADPDGEWSRSPMWGIVIKSRGLLAKIAAANQ
jgi:hypothetical protein